MCVIIYHHIQNTCRTFGQFSIMHFSQIHRWRCIPKCEDEEKQKNKMKEEGGKKKEVASSRFSIWKPVLGVFLLKTVFGCGMWLSVPTSLHFWIYQMKILNQQWLIYLNDYFTVRHSTAWSNLENALLVTKREYHSHHETLLRLSEGTNFSFPSWPQFLLSCWYGTII